MADWTNPIAQQQEAVNLLSTRMDQAAYNESLPATRLQNRLAYMKNADAL